jgi:hypothetical protein
MNKTKKPKKSKKKKPPTERMTKTLALVKEGYSLKRAMIEAGYSPMTAQKKSAEYLRKLDLDELRKGLRVQTALSSHKAFKVLNEMMDESEKDGDKIKAADCVLRSGRTFLEIEPGDTTIVFQLQTVKGQTIYLNTPQESDEIIDVAPEKEEGG